MEQNNTPLLDAVESLIDTKPAYFRIPGHRLERGVSSRWTDKTGDKIFAYDVTETPLTDDLHAPEGAIRKAQELLSGLYGADESFFLVNGTTCGNEAMLISAAFEGQEIMVARNAHKSALMGLVLSGAKPVYVMPEVIEDWGLQGAIPPDRVRSLFREHPECSALFLVSPSYYGICSDLAEIAEICHENNALLLVDEAHGGHLYFAGKPADAKMGALECGADICVQSMHKVTGALTQSSVLHIKDHGVRSEALLRVAENLHLVQSTSPSYLLMISLDCARYELAMHGEAMYGEARALSEDARRKINEIEGFACMGKTERGLSDETRLVISARGLGLSGYELDRLLFEKYSVNAELSDSENILAIVTFANTQEDIDRLVGACREIGSGLKTGRNDTSVINRRRAFPPLPKQCYTPRQAYFSEKKEIAWQQAVGRIAGQIIAPYPPGIPVICPGELIDREAWEYIEEFRRAGRHIHGAGKDGLLDKINIIE
ncbi:MAG: aminotransferase class V-fold PLP-dependent enzyme [Lachnospiraceae bacterium]|nr:aminotransferase class V-fold PLP-dependent enzyme [Lachnospiraceae bacterium]